MEPTNARNQVEIASRRQRVAEMYLRGAYQNEIAETLGVGQATISRDLAELRKEWLDRSINHIQQKKAIELAKLDQLELTYWAAWEHSKAALRICTVETGGKYGRKVDRKVEQRVGNPAFLEGVLKCIQKRCEIIGIDAPRKMDLTSDNKPLKALTDEQHNRAIFTLADALRDILPGASSGGNSPVDAAECPAMDGAPIEGR